MTIKAKDILSVTKNVTKEWTKQRAAEERGNRSKRSRQYVYSDRINFTDIAHEILPDAYQHASGNGKYTVSKRQFYYACRDIFKAYAGREIEFTYFAQTLLVQYLNRNPELTAEWKITADPRGTLTLPNGIHEVRVPCGTIDIEKHLKKRRHENLRFDASLPVAWPSLREGVRYQAVLYIEKEGFEPVLKEAKIAERFDLAVLSCKGQSVVAARSFVDEVCHAEGVPLLVVHDFDKAGFEIARSLTKVSKWAKENDRVAYQFKNQIDVHDLGLRLADAERFGLVHEDCTFKGIRNWNKEGICTAHEEAFLRSGKRIELNAFTAPQFVEWLEAKLTEHLPERLVPSDEILEKAYRRALAVAELNSVIREATDRVLEHAEEADIPEGLREALKQEMLDSDSAWDANLYRMAESNLNRE